MTRYAGVAVVFLAPLGMIAISGAPAAAQDQGQQMAGLAGGSASSSLSAFDAQAGRQGDVIIGQNSPGPYRLTWKGISATGVSVVRNGAPCRPGTDYYLDPTAGEITFVPALGAADMAQVTYEIGPGGSARNTGPVAQSLAWTLLTGAGGGLTIRSRFGGGASGAAPNSTLLAYTGHGALGTGATLTGAGYLDLRGGNVGDRSALSLGVDGKSGRAAYGLGFSHAGADASSDVLAASALHAGADSFDAHGTFAPSRGLSLSAVASAVDTASASGRSVSSTQGTALGATYALPDGAGALKAQRAVTSTTTNGAGTVTTTDAVDLTHRLGGSTTLDAGYTASAQHDAVSGASGQYTQSASFAAKSNLAKNLAIAAGYTNTLAGAGATNTTDLQLSGAPFAGVPGLKLAAGFTDVLGAATDAQSRKVMLTFPSLRFMNTQVSGGVQQSLTSSGALTTGLVSGSIQPQRYVSLTANAQLRDGNVAGGAPDPNAVNGYSVGLAVKPIRSTSIISEVAADPAAPDGTPQFTRRASVGLKTTLGALDLTGKYGTDDQYRTDTLLQTVQLGADVRLTPFDQLTTQYQLSSSAGTSVTATATYLLGFTHHFSDLLNFTLGGNLVLNSINGTAQWDTAELRARASVGIRF